MSKLTENPLRRTSCKVAPTPREASREAPRRDARNRFIAAKLVASFVPRLTKKAFEKHGFCSVALIADWAQIAGEAYAGHTVPEKLKWPRGVNVYDNEGRGQKGRPGATLILRVDPARALEVEYGCTQIIERINAYFGYRAVVAINLVQGEIVPRRRAGKAPATPPARKRAGSINPSSRTSLSGIEDDRLRAALENLQDSVLAT